MSIGNKGGRPPKPSHLKAVAGNPGGRPLPKDEPDPVGDLSSPPAFLTEPQKEIWRYATEHSPAGLLRLLDRDIFLIWVTAVAEIYEAEAVLRKTGPVIKQPRSTRTTKSANGTVTTITRPEGIVRSPWAVARDAAVLRMMKATTELGFSPTSRSRITLAGSGKKDTNRFSKHASGAA